ncbi:FapA family protein [Brachyspira hyodysenteriae]|nr:FapA family protein [Brachyspira hyodysenteriae]MCZ9988640.1 FapA family protein [Brachyspira hyodysenteriae]MCZ9996750.1 FapA family protein [Brachyspira hyodysenteriae]MDA0000193.1 FapA family protein [Brachyspira hyodysenteriae]MDA0005198.1 FapA family protein [Brachyspira hyodysenteriae]MDA0028019.1 FapA family protein [Brachyspira hyodysenteriae]
MNELKRKILQSDFYKNIYNNKNTRSVELSVVSLERGMQEAAAIFQCPIYELSYKVLEDGSKGFFNIGAKPFLVRYTHITYDKSDIGVSTSNNYDDSYLEGNVQQKVVFNKDTEVIVRVKRDGVFLKVNPPVGDGNRIEDITLLEEKLIEAGIKEYDSHLAKRMLDEQTGQYEKIAEWDIGKSANNAKISYTITEDKMRAYVTVTKPNKGGREMDLQDVKELLENCGVTFGFQEENVSKCLEEGTFNIPILAAEGRQPVNGQNAKIEYLVNVNKKVIPKFIGEDQSIDYKDLTIVENVEQGQKLARKTPATDGEVGRTVLGVKIETKSGKDIEIKEIVGDNVEMSDDGEYIIASISGQVVLKGKLLSVEPIFEVSGDVGPETGNINFIGSVVVKGSVSDNYSIKAEGNIDVHGTVGKCDLEAKGDIMVKLGIQGNENSHVKAGGDVIAKFIQFSNIEAGNNVVVTEAILNSNIDADNRIILIGKRASASGGRLRALREVNGKVLGSQAGAKTLIETGISPAKRRAIDDLDKEKEELDISIEETERNIKSLEQAGKLKKLDDEKKEQLQSYKEQLEQANTRREEIVLNREALIQEMEIEKVESTVSAGKEMLPGVELVIGSAEFSIRQSYKTITFFEQDGMIQTEKYRGEPKNEKKTDDDE